MKAKILLHKILAKGSIKAVDEKAQSYSKLLDNCMTFIKLAL